MTSRGAPILLAFAVTVTAACGGGRAASSTTATAAVATPTPTPLIDVNDMMGAFPPATFFVVAKDGIKAIALLNHATKYSIAYEGAAPQLATATQTGNVYVLDQTAAGARLRSFDTATGVEFASRMFPGESVIPAAIAHATLAVDGSNGVVATMLRQRNGDVALRTYDTFGLRPAREIAASVGCADTSSTASFRLAAAAGRVAVACLGGGRLVVSDSDRTFTRDVSFPIVALAMLGEGTLMAGGSDGSLVRLAPHAKELEVVGTLKDYGRGLIPDGIAANGDCCFYFGIIDPTANDVQPRLIAGGTALVAFPAIAQPTGGLLVQAPFAYYVIGGRARHTDINQGFSEVMADLGAGALPGAVSNR